MVKEAQRNDESKKVPFSLSISFILIAGDKLLHVEANFSILLFVVRATTKTDENRS